MATRQVYSSQASPHFKRTPENWSWHLSILPTVASVHELSWKRCVKHPKKSSTYGEHSADTAAATPLTAAFRSVALAPPAPFSFKAALNVRTATLASVADGIFGCDDGGGAL